MIYHDELLIPISGNSEISVPESNSDGKIISATDFRATHGAISGRRCAARTQPEPGSGSLIFRSISQTPISLMNNRRDSASEISSHLLLFPHQETVL